MTGFSVSVPAVDALSFRVATAASDVRAAEGRLLATSCPNAGYADLAGALSSYSVFWHAFTQGAAGVVDTTASAIASAATSYQTVDDSVMVNPALTTSFVSASLAGNDSLLQLLVAPTLGGAPPEPGGTLLPLPGNGG